MQHGTETGWLLTWGQGILWHGGQQTGAALLQTGSNKPFISSWSDIVPGHQGRDSALSLTSKNVLFRQKDEGSAALKALWVKYAISVKGNKWLLASVGAVTMTTQRVCVLLVSQMDTKTFLAQCYHRRNRDIWAARPGDLDGLFIIFLCPETMAGDWRELIMLWADIWPPGAPLHVRLNYKLASSLTIVENLWSELDFHFYLWKGETDIDGMIWRIWMRRKIMTANLFLFYASQSFISTTLTFNRPL